MKIRDRDYYKYRHLEMNPYINSLTSEDLPCEFSQKAVSLVDVFRRKTIDLDYEVMLIFDYVTSEMIYCFVNDAGDGNEVYGDVDVDVFKGKHISVIHNHPEDYYSPPSARNFQILDFNFEDYELVSSRDSLWILESKNHIPKDEINQIKEHIQFLHDFAREEGFNNFDDEDISFKISSNLYGELLMEYINNLEFNIRLRRISNE